MWIVVADDHSVLRELIAASLGDFGGPGTRITEADSYSAVLELVSEQAKPNLILIDLQMPGSEKLSGLQSVIEAFPGTKVAVMTGVVDPDIARKCLRMGAHGFITKATRTKTIHQALKLILSGTAYVPPFILEGPPESTNQSVPHKFQKSLTEQEKAIAAHLLKGSTNKVIAEINGIKESTVRSHLQNIYKKINSTSRKDAIQKLSQIL